jgi:hypothetical protein
MANVVMRNVRNGELRTVEAEGEDFLTLQREVYDHGGSTRPLWEQTSGAHGRELVGRAEDEALQEEDLGYEHQADRPEILYDVGPEPAPHTALTPAEVEAGLTSEQKQEEQADQIERAKAKARGERFDEASDVISDADIPRPRDEDSDDGAKQRRKRSKSQVQNKGQRARAGGSDDDDSSSSSSGTSRSGQQPAGSGSGSGASS